MGKKANRRILCEELDKIKKVQEKRENTYLTSIPLVEMENEKLSEYCRGFVKDCKFDMDNNEKQMMFITLRESVKWATTHCIEKDEIERRKAERAEKQREMSERAMQIQIQLAEMERGNIQVMDKNGNWVFKD